MASDCLRLEQARRDLKAHLADRPVITGWPGFDAKAHIEAVDSWIKERDRLITKVETLTLADERARTTEYSRRRAVWLAKHYPNGVNP